jgi:hypothetical protein
MLQAGDAALVAQLSFAKFMIVWLMLIIEVFRLLVYFGGGFVGFLPSDPASTPLPAMIYFLPIVIAQIAVTTLHSTYDRQWVIPTLVIVALTLISTIVWYLWPTLVIALECAAGSILCGFWLTVIYTIDFIMAVAASILILATLFSIISYSYGFAMREMLTSYPQTFGALTNAALSDPNYDPDAEQEEEDAAGAIKGPRVVADRDAIGRSDEEEEEEEEAQVETAGEEAVPSASRIVHRSGRRRGDTDKRD